VKLLRDIDIREPLIARLDMQNAGHDYRIISEMGICDGMARADVAVANGRLCGYEIKSDVDTLERLPAQQEYYNKTFDKVSIVVGEKYKDQISQHIPDWWGIFVAQYSKSGHVRLVEKRRGRQNVSVSGDALLELLWRDELDLLLKSHGIKGISGRNRRILRKIAIQNLTLKEIKTFVLETIKRREAWR